MPKNFNMKINGKTETFIGYDRPIDNNEINNNSRKYLFIKDKKTNKVYYHPIWMSNIPAPENWQRNRLLIRWNEVEYHGIEPVDPNYEIKFK